MNIVTSMLMLLLSCTLNAAQQKYVQQECVKQKFNFALDQELIAAVKGNNVSLVRTLLFEQQANPNAYDDEGNTPLHLASTPGLVILLLEFGAKSSLKNKMGQTPLMYHISLKNGSIAQKLMHDHSIINKQDAHGNTALFYAVKRKMISTVRALLRNGANCTVPNKKGKTITDIADREIAEIIHQHVQHTLCHALKNNSDI